MHSPSRSGEKMETKKKPQKASGPQKIAGLVVALAVVLTGGFALEKYILPEEAVEKNEELPGHDSRDHNHSDTEQETEEVEVLKQGEFTGKTGHKVQGTVKIVRIDGDHYLRFENYEQTLGPDVFLYLTETEDPDTNSEISNGEKIRIDGGPDNGEITKEGNFNQKIPEEINPEDYSGVAVWCDAFSVPFGAAELQ